MFWRSGGPRGLQKKSSIVLAKEIRTSVSYIQRALFSPFLLSDVVTFAGGPRNLLNALECSVIFTRPPFFYLVSKHAQTFTHFFALSYRHFLLLHHSRPTPAQTTFQCPFSHPLISATVLLFFGNHQFDTTIYLGTQCQNIKAWNGPDERQTEIFTGFAEVYQRWFPEVWQTEVSSIFASLQAARSDHQLLCGARSTTASCSFIDVEPRSAADNENIWMERIVNGVFTTIKIRYLVLLYCGNSWWNAAFRLVDL